MRAITRFVVLEDDDLLGGLLEQWLLREFPGSSVRRFLNAATLRASITEFAAETDVFIADVRLQDGDGVDVAVELRKASGTDVSTVIMSGRPTADLFNRMSSSLQAGWAFILKQSSGMDTLRQAISVVQNGMVMVDPQLHNSGTSSEVDLLLSEPERDILKRVAEGKSNKTIAGELFTSEKTVERHLSSTYAKLNLEGRSKSLNPRVVASLRYLGLL